MKNNEKNFSNFSLDESHSNINLNQKVLSDFSNKKQVKKYI